MLKDSKLSKYLTEIFKEIQSERVKNPASKGYPYLPITELLIESHTDPRSATVIFSIK